MKPPRWASLFAVVALACGESVKQPAGEHGEAEHAEAEHEEGEEEEHGASGEVVLTAEAIERAGIVLGVAERRALTGGVAIPAEVEFDPTATAHVGPLVPGRFTRIDVGIGDRVAQGDLLGTVASTDVSAARSQLQQARARLTAAETTMKRQQQLAAEGIGAQRSLVEAEAAVGELRAEVEGLRRQLSVFGSGRAGELRLLAPIAGVVVDVQATLGETASADRAAFVVTDPARIWVRGNVPELELANIDTASAATVRLHAYPELVLSGTITYRAPALDHGTRSLPIRVTLDQIDTRLRSGLFGSIELVGGEHDERVLSVPAEAIANLDGQYAVFVPGDEPNSFRPRPVVLGRRAGAFFEVKSGLEEGDAVVTRGAFTLKSVLKSGELSEGHAH